MSSESDSSTQNCDVLVVEDDSATRMLLQKIISLRGHKVTACETAEAALQLIKNKRFPLIFLDILLPGMSGLDFARRLRRMPDGEYYYILVGTASSGTAELREILDAGANDYIAKPYNPGLLDVRLTVAEAQLGEIAARQKLEAELKFLAHHDPLTKLFNRSQLDAALEAAIHSAKIGRPAAVLYIDLDNFKIVNDTLGHDAGDRLLILLSQLLKESTRSQDVLVRFGGDEFVVILNHSELEDALETAERLRLRIEDFQFEENGRVFRVGASIGIAQILEDSTPGDVLGAADAACYAAKAKGRNRVEVHWDNDQSSLARLIADTDWSSRIKEAIREGHLQLWFQPILPTDFSEISFQEGLLRLIEPDTGHTVNPATFLNAVYRSGQRERLDRFIIDKAAQLLGEYPDLKISLNFSGLLFEQPSNYGYLLEEFASGRIDGGRVIIEITETEFISNLPQAAHVMWQMRDLGLRFALDDFGSGFSSLAYLKALPIDMIKIEGSFVRDLPNQPFNQAVIQAIRTMADAMRIKTVAESVETVEELQMVSDLGIDLIQGYLCGRPRAKAYTHSEIAHLQSSL